MRTRLAGRCGTACRATAVVSGEEDAWLVAHVRAVLAASSVVWASRGMASSQLTGRHLAGQTAATYVMVDRLISTGLRRDVGLGGAICLQTMVNGMSACGPSPLYRRANRHRMARSSPPTKHPFVRNFLAWLRNA
jgi:hypothetical protein